VIVAGGDEERRTDEGEPGARTEARPLPGALEGGRLLTGGGGDPADFNASPSGELAHMFYLYWEAYGHYNHKRMAEDERGTISWEDLPP
jgi:hypothetical protein